MFKFFKKIREKIKKDRQERQDWKPKGLLRILKYAWTGATSLVKIAIGAAVTVLCIVVICGLVFVGLLGNYLQDDILPNATFSLEGYDQDETSFMYYTDANGDIQVLQQIFTTTDRQKASFEDLPSDLIHAAIAIEDQRFYQHQGVDWITTIKACMNMFFGSSSSFGGSTITQQLVKNLTEDDDVTVQRKVIEIFKAQDFERRYDKDTIMEWYMNTIYLGNGYYGVKSAAAGYFGKELQMLTVAECASIIGITKNPSYFDPYAYDAETGFDGKANNKQRQLDILWAMYQQGWITEDQYYDAKYEELNYKSGISKLDKWTECSNEECEYENVLGAYTPAEDGQYYCPECSAMASAQENASQSVYSWYVETALDDVAEAFCELNGEVWEDLSDKGREAYIDLIKRGGYHIYTCLDMEVQDQVDAIYTNLDEIPDARSGQQLQSAIVVKDNVTGDIVAISGGVGEKKEMDAYNRATVPLQTGSAIKPLAVYAPAFEIGAITPATVVKDLPMYYDRGPYPLNDSMKYSNGRTIYQGVVSSINAICIDVLNTIGTEYSFEYAKDKFGLSTLVEEYLSPWDGEWKSDIDLSPLGMGALTKGATVRDMADAFGTFSNDGVWREGRTYTKVYDSDGNLILDNSQDSREIISDKTLNYMNYCMLGAVNGGTGTAAQISGQTVAGKTGTSQDFKDRWFCGFTGYYTAAVWVGYDNPERINLVNDWANPACRLFEKVMRPLHQGLSRVPVYSSSGMSSVTMCLESGKLATDACGADVRVVEGSDFSRTASAYVYYDDRPTEVCDKHVMVDYCTSGDGAANEYCHMFAALDLAKVEQKALVKLTEKEVAELKKAGENGLKEEYVMDKYVYLVGEDGQDLNFHGFKGDLNVGVNAPCITCTVHTQAAWDQLGQTMPSDPTDPNAPTDPTQPSEPAPAE